MSDKYSLNDLEDAKCELDRAYESFGGEENIEIIIEYAGELIYVAKQIKKELEE